MLGVISIEGLALTAVVTLLEGPEDLKSRL